MQPARLAHYVRHPLVGVHRIWRAFYDRRHPGDPWLAPSAIAILDAYLTSSMRVLEWGSGRSTVWFGRRAGSVVSVEHAPAWHAKVQTMIADAGLDDIDLRLHPIPDEPDARAAAYWADHPYVMVVEAFPDETFDLVLVDGAYRQPCVARALPKIKGGACWSSTTAGNSRVSKTGWSRRIGS